MYEDEWARMDELDWLYGAVDGEEDDFFEEKPSNPFGELKYEPFDRRWV